MTDDTISEANLVPQLLLMFPELEERCRQEFAIRAADSTANCDIVRFVFVAAMDSELKKGQITQFLERCAEFIERVCSQGDRQSNYVICHEVLTPLLRHEKRLDLLWRSLGPATQRCLEAAAVQSGSRLKVERSHASPDLQEFFGGS